MLAAWVLLVLIVLVSSARCRGAGDEQRWRGVFMQPQLAQRNPGDSVAVLCQTPLPMHACQFLVKLETEVREPKPQDPLDFGQGPASPPQTVIDGGAELFVASYHGAGLEAGQCGMTMAKLTSGRYFVGCRVRSGDSGWLYDFMALVVHTNRISRTVDFNKTLAAFPLDVAERKRPLPTVWFTANASESVTTCKFYLPHQRTPEMLTTPSNLTVTKTEHRVTLRGNQCGVELLSASDATNGVVWCLYLVAGSTDYKLFAPRVFLTRERPSASLAAAPGNLTVGDEFTASCTAASARPPARITWTLAGRTMRDDDRDDDDLPRPWVWPWSVRSVTQVLKHTLSRDELGKNVTCRVSQIDGQVQELVALVHRDASICIDGFVMCHWVLILVVTAAVVAVIATIAVIVYVHSRREWRW